MKKLYILATVCLALFSTSVLVSCNPEEPSIISDATSFESPSNGGSQSVSMTTNYEWTAKTSDPWLTVSPASGAKGTASFTIRAEANNSGAVRKGGVTVTCSTLNKSITVTQKPNMNQALIIKHTNSSFRVPSIKGNGFSGIVNWGDGAEENYSSSLSHTYSSSGSHILTIKSVGGTAFDLESIAGISEIDMGDF